MTRENQEKPTAPRKSRSGRPEKPVDPEAGPVEKLAWELRRLRERAGRPSYRLLAQRTHYAASTLADAAKGDRLPTLDVVIAYATACGGKRPEWQARWAATAHAEPPDNHHKNTPPKKTTPTAPSRRSDNQPTAQRRQPHQLPATLPDFTGRKTLISQLSTHLTAQRHRGTTPIQAIAGAGGVGKTTLAVHLAHHVQTHFPDGQLYADLQGTGHTPTQPTTVLGAFLRALDVQDTTIPKTITERTALFRSILDGRRTLILLDNARDAAQIRPLIPGNAGCAVLITSRARLTGLAGAHQTTLDVMNTDEALALFTRIVGPRAHDNDRATTDIIHACGRLPLAVRIAASRLSSRQAWTTTDLARKLNDEQHRLHTLQAGDQAVTASFEMSYTQLPPPQARAFRLLALPQSPDLSLPAASALLGLNTDDGERLLESLVDTSLLETPTPGRYRYHDLLAHYARTTAHRDEPPKEQADAMSRLLDFYLATAQQLYAFEHPGDPLVAHLEPTRQQGLRLADRDTALEWLFTEAPGLLACARQSTDTTTLRRAADLLLVTRFLVEAREDTNRHEQVTAELLAIAEKTGDAHAEGRLRRLAALSLIMEGRSGSADAEARHVIALHARSHDPVALANGLNDCGMMAYENGRYDEAERYLTQALDAFRSYQNPNGEAAVLCNLARTHLYAGRLTAAESFAERSLSLYQNIGATVRLANSLYNLGLILARADRPDDAFRHLRQASAIFHDHRQPLWEGMTYFRMAQVHLDKGSPTRAAELAERALATLPGTGDEGRRAAVHALLERARPHRTPTAPAAPAPQP